MRTNLLLNKRQYSHLPYPAVNHHKTNIALQKLDFEGVFVFENQMQAPSDREFVHQFYKRRRGIFAGAGKCKLKQSFTGAENTV